MKQSFASYLILLIIGWIPNIMAEEEDICNFQSGDYKTVRLLDGKISLFKGDKYYIFSDGDIKNAEIHPIKDIYPHTSTPINECFETNERIYCLRGNDVIVYKDHIDRDENPTLFDWRVLEPKIDHLLIRRNGKTISFFVPPKTSGNGFSQSISRTNDLEVMSFGGGSISSSSINGIHKIQYNGWNIPIEFNAFMVNKDKSLTFFNKDKYCVVKRNSMKKNFVWEDVSTLFGC